MLSDDPNRLVRPMSPNNFRSIFSKRLKSARMAAEISQRELGRRIGLSEDVVSSRVARYELGTSEPDFATANELARQLGVPLAYLLTENDTLAEIILVAATLPPSDQKQLLHYLRESWPTLDRPEVSKKRE